MRLPEKCISTRFFTAALVTNCKADCTSVLQLEQGMCFWWYNFKIRMAHLFIIPTHNKTQSTPTNPHKRDYTEKEYHKKIYIRTKKKIKETQQWLTDKHIIAALKLLNKQFPSIKELQLPFFEQMNQLKAMPSNGVQILIEKQSLVLCFHNIITTKHMMPMTVSKKQSVHM